MAAIHSLGLHKPSALDHLVAESLLPPNPPPELYTWEIYADGGVEEELLSTKNCVVWSQGRIVRKLFNFSIEQEQVHHAKLAWFRDSDDRNLQRLDDSEPSEPLPPKKRRLSNPQSGHKHGHSQPRTTASARALVVFLKYQAHVFFLSGASHVVNLPFEVERAFPAPRGLILQRKLSTVPAALQLSLIAPAPPQNSFLSPLSQVLPRQFSTFLTPAVSKGSLAPHGLDFDLLQSPTTPADDGLPRHYSFTSPLSELALIVRNVVGGQSRNSTATHFKTLSALDLDEDILYVTPRDETNAEDASSTEPLTLIVTLNRTKGLYSLWQASYIGTKPVSKLLTGRSTPTSGTKSRRRSSFVTATGASTPAARPRDSVRESMGVVRSKAAGGKAASGTNKKTKKPRASKATKAVEESLAAQVDPDFEPRQHTARESRRVSSMLSRADLNASFDRNAFQDLASQSGVQNSFAQSGRRGQSLGAGERQSFGASSFRRLRASTPGAFSQLSIEDFSENGTAFKSGINESQASTTMDEYDQYADLDGDLDDAEDVNLQNPLYGLKKELLVRKFAEIPAPSQTPTSSANDPFSGNNTSLKPVVFSVSSPISYDEVSDYGRRFFLIIFDRSRKECVQVEYSVRNKTSQPVMSQERFTVRHPKTIPLPSFRAVTRLGGIIDTVALPNNQQSRILLLKDGRSSQSDLWIYSPWSPEALVQLPNRRLRIFNPHDIGTTITTPRGVGVKRTTSLTRSLNASGTEIWRIKKYQMENGMHWWFHSFHCSYLAKMKENQGGHRED
jgi:anaphase-promoting complex subunit 1